MEDKSNGRLKSLKAAILPHMYSFKDLSIYSRSYFKKIIWPIFDEENDSVFSVIYGDFNKLGNLNSRCGQSIGDIALYNSLQIITENLPEDAIVTRIAGDEFVIVLKNTPIEQSRTLISNINTALLDLNNYSKTYGLTITLAGTDSSSHASFGDMLIFAEQEVEKRKQLFRKSTPNSWLDIKKNIQQNIADYFNNFRIHPTTELDSDILNINPKVMASTINAMLDAHSADKEQDNSKMAVLDNIISSSSNILSASQANIFHEFLKSNSDSEPSELPDATLLSKLLCDLSIDYNTKQLSKIYFDTILRKKLESSATKSVTDYNIMYLHTTGLKISNTINGHTCTDGRLKDLSEIIEDTFSKTIINRKNGHPLVDPTTKRNVRNNFFNKTPLSINEDDNFLIDFRGGNYVIITPKQFKAEELEDIEAKINQSLNDDSLSCFLSMQNMRDFDSINSAISFAQQSCSNKCRQKLNRLNPFTIQRLFNKYVSNSCEHYQKNIDEPSDMKNLKKFISIFVTTFGDYYYRLKNLEDHSVTENER